MPARIPFADQLTNEDRDRIADLMSETEIRLDGNEGNVRLRWRRVHAKRARTLRKRPGVRVHPLYTQIHGRMCAVFVWLGPIGRNTEMRKGGIARAAREQE